VREELARWAAAAALPASQIADLQLAVGEAVANSVEHAYGSGGAFAGGDVTVTVAVRDGADVHAEVRDEGRWRDRAAEQDRGGDRRAGHGMDVLAALGRDLAVDTTGAGSRVTFVVPAPAAAGAHRSPSDPAPLPAGDELRVQEQRRPDGALRLSLAGDLDLATAPLLEDAVRARLAGATGPPVVLDLTGLRYLSSAGVGLLADLRRAAPDRLRIVTRGGTPAARVLALSGLDHVAAPDR
jgi:anti-anti-sigma factor